MRTVKELLQSKAPGVVTIAADASVFEALQLMAERDIGAVVATDGDRVVGVLSERDYARKVILHHKSSRETLVSEIMAQPVFYVSPTDGIDECMVLMTDRHVRHLPVFEDDGRLAGILSIGDLVKATLTEQQFVIKQLEHYIAS